jgi:indole-3-glycerol phosphate synthase
VSVLDAIVAAKAREAAALRARLSVLRERAEAAPRPRGFAAALRRPDVAVIAEVKRRSPSAGWIRRDADAAVVAQAYAGAGAAAVSVLTDAEFFGGDAGDLEAVRGAVAVPVLRKDFVLEEAQVWEARALGADAVLLIVRILEDARLRALRELAEGLGMGVLVEAHDASELERALNCGAAVVGVNARDLGTFRTDLTAVERLAAEVPAGVLLVAESGVRDGADVARLGDAGADAVLVGETLMRQEDPGAALAALTGWPRRERPPAPGPGPEETS